MAQEAVEEERQEGITMRASGAPVMRADYDSSMSDIEDQLSYLLNRSVRLNFHVEATRRRFEGQRIEAGDEVRLMSLDKLVMKYKALRDEIEDKGKHWWTFGDVAPTWEDNIQKVFAGKVTQGQNKEISHVLLHEGERCIMGESWGGTGWNGCNDCNWLGTDGLNMFTGGGHILEGKRTEYEEYKLRYEYHWNKYHYDVGASLSKVPVIDF